MTTPTETIKPSINVTRKMLDESSDSLCKDIVTNKLEKSLEHGISFMRIAEKKMRDIEELSDRGNKEGVLHLLKSDDQLYSIVIGAAMNMTSSYLELAYPALATVKMLNGTLQDTDEYGEVTS